MKNSIILSLLCMILICCSRNESNESITQNSKRIKKIVSLDNQSRKLSANFFYLNNNLTSITSSYESPTNNSNSTITINYSNGKVNYISEGNSTFSFNYQNDRVSSITYNNVPGYQGQNATYNFTYDSSNNISKIICNYPFNETITTNLNYSNQNITNYQIKFTQIPANNTDYNLTYDNKNNPFAGLPIEIKIYFALSDGLRFQVFTDLFGSFWNSNNVITLVRLNSMNNYILNFNYEYSNNLPTKLTVTRPNINYTSNYQFTYE